MEEEINIDQPFITDPEVIEQFLKMGIDPTQKSAKELEDEIAKAIAKESALLIFDPKDPLDYITYGLGATGIGTGAALGIKSLRTGLKAKKTTEKISKFKKLKNLLNPFKKASGGTGQVFKYGPGQKIITVGSKVDNFPKIPGTNIPIKYNLKIPQTSLYGAGGTGIIDDTPILGYPYENNIFNLDDQRSDFAEASSLLQDDIDALKVEEVTFANQELQEAKDNLDKYKTKKVDEDGETSYEGIEVKTTKEDVKPKVSDLFGTPQFDDFLRNVGSALVQTGQLGSGLAQGAAKASEERAAKELAIKLELIKAGGKGAIKPELKYKMDADYIEATKNIADNATSLNFLNQVETILSQKSVTGVSSLFKQYGYKIRALGDPNTPMDAKTQVENLLREISIGNAEQVLGQSSGRLSDKDIELAGKLVGELEGLRGLTTTSDEILSIMAKRRSDIERDQAQQGTTYTRLENDYYRYGVKPPDTGLFAILESLNTQAGGQTQEQPPEKTRIPLNPKDEALAEAGAN